ncbi:MAG TPA: hypothetical protein VJP87_10555 [Candidatus Acidoferrales bacterium]|nr:hypothetical protein [Candidatus Acidoferrales bacterium]
MPIEMTDELHLEHPQEQPPGNGSRLLIAVIVAAVIVLGFIFFWPRSVHHDVPQSYTRQLPFGPAEQAYAKAIRIESVSLSRAENFLHQEVTTVSAVLANDGDRTLQEIQISADFYDEIHQVVLQESRHVLAGSPLRPHASANIEISVEHIPSMWDRQPPGLHITGLLFAP